MKEGKTNANKHSNTSHDTKSEEVIPSVFQNEIGYLSGTVNNTEHLLESISQFENGEIQSED